MLARQGGVPLNLSEDRESVEGRGCKVYSSHNDGSSSGRMSSCSRYVPYTPGVDESLAYLHPSRVLSGLPHSHAHGDVAPSPTSRSLPTTSPAPPLGTRPLHSLSPSRARAPDASIALLPTQNRARDKDRVGQGQVTGRVKREKERWVEFIPF